MPQQMTTPNDKPHASSHDTPQDTPYDTTHAKSHAGRRKSKSLNADKMLKARFSKEFVKKKANQKKSLFYFCTCQSCRRAQSSRAWPPTSDIQMITTTFLIFKLPWSLSSLETLIIKPQNEGYTVTVITYIVENSLSSYLQYLSFTPRDHLLSSLWSYLWPKLSLISRAILYCHPQSLYHPPPQNPSLLPYRNLDNILAPVNHFSSKRRSRLNLKEIVF